MNMNNTIKAFAAACFMSTTNAVEYPGDNCCTFWRLWNFRAYSDRDDDYVTTWCHDGNNEEIAYVYNVLDTSFESIFCGKNVEFTMIMDQAGDNWIEVRGAGYFASGHVASQEQDWATQYKLKPYDADTQGAVTFFDHTNCTGRQGLVFWDNKTTMISREEFQSHHNMHFRSDDEVDNEQSVLIPKGYELEMFSDEQFGQSVGVLSTHSYLNDHGKVACQTIPGDINSFELRKISQPPAQGRWVQSKFNNDIRKELSIGLDIETTDKDRSEVLHDIGYSLDAGFEFGDESLSSVFQDAEKQTVLQSARLTMPSTQQVFCMAEENKAALYQWIVQAGGHTIRTDHFICRSGADAWKFPNCADSACDDDQCDQCIA